MRHTTLILVKNIRVKSMEKIFPKVFSVFKTKLVFFRYKKTYYISVKYFAIVKTVKATRTQAPSYSFICSSTKVTFN